MNERDEKQLLTRKKEINKKDQMKPVTWKGSRRYGKQISEISRGKIKQKRCLWELQAAGKKAMNRIVGRSK